MEYDLKVQLFLDKRNQGIVEPSGGYLTQSVNDCYVNVFLNRKTKIIDEYIDIELDPFRTEMDRQLINPWFNEFSFFESITTTGITGKTIDMSWIPEEQNLIKKAKKYSIDINK